MGSDNQVERSLALSNGRRLHWCEYGSPTGRPLLYCHGLPGSRLELTTAAEPAADHGLRLIVPDRSGYGGTSSNPGRTLAGTADDVEALLDYLDIHQLDIMGFSGGGPHAMAIASRLGKRVGHLYLVSSWAPFDRAGKAGMAEANRQLWGLCAADFDAFAMALQGAIDSAGGAYELLLGGALDVDQRIFQDADLATQYRANTEAAMTQGLTGMLEDARAVIAPWPFQVEALPCSTRLWHGTSDANAPFAMGQWLAAHLPEADLTPWPQAGHFEMFRRWPELLATVAGNQGGAKP